IENGCLYVNGVPVNETASGKDTICPVTSSLMTALLPDAISVACLSEDELIEKMISFPQKQIVIDAKSDADLDIIAAVIKRLGKKIIPVGSAGLAQKLKFSEPDNACSGREKLNLGRTLIVVTSIHETSQTQVDQYISTAGGKSIVFNPAPSQLMNYQISETALKQQLNALINSSDDNVIIRANPAKVINIDKQVTEIASSIAEYLADLAKYALDKQKFDSLMLFGGDGAAALLDRMDITEMQVLYAVIPGVPLCTIDRGIYAGMKVMTKSGGFGRPDLLNNIMQM
ncbi:MAG TPA: hypothetical protein DD638_09280, partial [Pasteurellaceae bacterium]|nr:hypothetical protein [Pasteurellaceae bacterium]